MFQRLDTPQAAYNFKLGAALKLEQKVLDKRVQEQVAAVTPKQAA
jgi:hypothetical protein